MKLQNTDFVNSKAIHYTETETILESFLACVAMVALIAVGCTLLFLVAPV